MMMRLRSCMAILLLVMGTAEARGDDAVIRPVSPSAVAPTPIQDSRADIQSVAPDRVVPPMVAGEPAPVRRVRQVTPGYEQTQVYHTLYLPTDWRRGGRYPVIVEYTGNGPYENKYGDVCSGRVEDAKLGYGLGGGEGFIWVCMPFLNNKGTANVRQWWGDPPGYDARPTVEYCKKTVQYVCERWGGDARRVVLVGFSRGSIACNYIGLHDDRIAKLWRAFVCYSHYDGLIENWPYPGADRKSATERLNRLAGRAQFICGESQESLDQVRAHLKSTGVEAPFAFVPTGFRNHNDAWVLRPSKGRTQLRDWLSRVVLAAEVESP